MLNLDGIWEFAWTENDSDVPKYDSFAGVPFRMKNCTASVERVPLEDSTQTVHWGKSVSRINVTAQSGAEGECSLVFTFQSVPDGKQRL